MMNGGDEMITVTMPMHEYEKMKKELDRLREESIYRFANREFSDIKRDEYEITLDVSSILSAIEQKERKPVAFKMV